MLRSYYKEFILEEEQKPTLCAHPNCNNEANYPAPKHKIMPDSMNPDFTNSFCEEKTSEKILLCLNHVKQYNKGWDFFSGMSQEQIEKFTYDAITAHRVTRKIAPHIALNDINAKAYEKAWNFKNGQDNSETSSSDNSNIAQNERDAMQILGLTYPLTKENLKSKHRKLVKKFHPDANKNSHEDKFRIISEAYNLLRKSL